MEQLQSMDNANVQLVQFIINPVKAVSLVQVSKMLKFVNTIPYTLQLKLCNVLLDSSHNTLLLLQELLGRVLQYQPATVD